jgi:hypothetical protein
MVKHIVFFKLKAQANGATKAENARSIKEKLEALRGRIPGLRHLEVGLNFAAGDAAWDIALYSELESREALERYQNHPEHQKAAEFIGSVRESRALVDYEA